MSAEPMMAVCECGLAVEADEIIRVAIPGGDGETRNYCGDCDPGLRVPYTAPMDALTTKDAAGLPTPKAEAY